MKTSSGKKLVFSMKILVNLLDLNVTINVVGL